MPFVDYLLFRHPRRNRVALNIGGIAQYHGRFRPARGADEVIAFDTGPGNMVIDALVGEHTDGKQRYDRGGRIAARGKVNQIAARRAAGRSVLRAEAAEERRPRAVRRGIRRAPAGKRQCRSLDLIATATVLTAATIAVGIGRFAADGGDLIVSGGGAHNPEIMAHLAAFLPQFSIATSADYGIDVDAKEAIAFAILAHETWRRQPVESALGDRRASSGDSRQAKPARSVGLRFRTIQVNSP